MDTLRWFRRNGEIIGCEHKGIEYTVYAIVTNKDQTLHKLYHEQIKEEANAKETDKWQVHTDHNSWRGVRGSGD